MWQIVRPRISGGGWTSPELKSDLELAQEMASVRLNPGMWEILFDGEILKVVEISSWDGPDRFLIYLKEM